MKLRHLIAGAVLSAGATLAQAQAQGPAMDGKALFTKNCAACHQASGKGIPGAFPALAGNAFVQGPATDPATVLLKGRGGMPDFSNSLDDGEIAAVLSYVRSSWGNSAAPLSADDVTAQRTALGVAPATHGKFGNKH
ncbi:cytochrome c [Massilia sp. 9096]|uniref:c-type cytochrome n=1 Tax=Massilia sp. 9096 TaxID=1500894 RepID=UPI00055A33CD|nr:cytochrome c [Massilia sp. 9096]